MAIEFLHQGGLPHQGADKAYALLLPEAAFVSQNGLFALLIRDNKKRQFGGRANVPTHAWVVTS